MVFIGDIREINMDGINKVTKAMPMSETFSHKTAIHDISMGTKET